jgi:hypothetical protein
VVAARIGLSGLAAAGLWLVFHSPRLAVRRVEVVGTQRLTVARVLELAGVPTGRNIFSINLYRARLRVESDPLIEDTEVTRALPNTVRILVQERQPVFVVSCDGKLFEADAQGYLFRAVPRPTPRLPLLAVKNAGSLAVGQQVSAEILKPALACLDLTAKDRLLLWKINVDGPHELCLNMKVPSRNHPGSKTLRVRVGRPEDLEQKLADLRKVLAGRPQVVDIAQYLDVSCAGRPVYLAQAPTKTASTPGVESGPPAKAEAPPPH